MNWDDVDGLSHYVVQVVGVESQSRDSNHHEYLVGCYQVLSPFYTTNDTFTKMTGYFPIRFIEKMEKVA
jgi:hypothetical protein